MNNTLIIDKTDLSFEQVKDSLKFKSHVSLSDKSVTDIHACRNYLDKKITNNQQLFYGINTGFGFLQDVKIDSHQIEQLQYNLLMSHA
ncbi:aromatic amino acid lyase, partial [Vibrio parahaemolyticus]